MPGEQMEDSEIKSSVLSRSLRSALLAAALALPVATAPSLAPFPALAQTVLPSPYLSYALDALLMPIDDTVRATFGLAPEDSGVFVLATAPGGLAEGAGLLPGDVLDYVQGEEILSPEYLDSIIWNWLQLGITDYAFDGKRAGAALVTETVITIEYWEETVEIVEISSWSSYSYEGFSYEEYSTEYSEEISVSYEQQSFEETEEQVTEDTAEEAIEEDVIDEASAEEEVCTGEIIDGVCMDATEGFGADEGADESFDEGGDEGGGEEEFIE
jgi:hypothetical protein